MLNTTKHKAGRSAAAVLLVVIMAVSVFAQSPRHATDAQRQVADQLADFKSKASRLSQEADALQSHVRQRLTWQSQSSRLGTIADQLADFKSKASRLSQEADALQSHVRQRLTWQSQSSRLGTIADHVNQMGKSLAELEAMKPMATDNQQMAIEHSRDHLVAISEHTTRAIELIKDNRHNVQFTEYGDTVNDLQAHAEVLHTKLDTILDFENARLRMEALELQSRRTEGS